MCMHVQSWRRTCMRGLVGDSTMTNAVRPFCTAASTALHGGTSNTMQSRATIRCQVHAIDL